MIEYRKGDILKALKDGEIDIFGHGCNCVGKFGAGIVVQIGKQFPKVKEVFYDTHGKSIDCLGKCVIVDVECGRIANLYIQHFVGRGRQVDYEGLYDSLEDLYIHSKSNNLKVGLPKLGAGLAGGDWNIIEAMINSIFDEVVVYEYNG